MPSIRPYWRLDNTDPGDECEAMKRLGALCAVLTAAAAMCGCAGSPEAPPSLITDGAATPSPASAGASTTAPTTTATVIAPPAPPAAASATTPVAAGDYQLSEQELKYECKKLTGIMQIRILQIRDYDPKKQTSAVARNAQALATPIFGGTTVGTDPAGQYRKDRAMLEAYNRRLAEKKCKTYDLAAALQSSPQHEVPRPTVKPAPQ
jgi:hypothetical protein